MSSLVNYIKAGDSGLFVLLNRRLSCRMLDIIMQIFTGIGSLQFAIALPLGIIIFYYSSDFAFAGVRMAVVLSLSQVVVHLLKRIVNRPRPYKARTDVITIRPPACIYSFPSGHTCAAFALALVFASTYPALQIICILTASLVGMSRVYLGAHYPTDVLMGFLIAYGSFVLERTYLISSLFVC